MSTSPENLLKKHLFFFFLFSNLHRMLGSFFFVCNRLCTLVVWHKIPSLIRNYPLRRQTNTSSHLRTKLAYFHPLNSTYSSSVPLRFSWHKGLEDTRDENLTSWCDQPLKDCLLISKTISVMTDGKIVISVRQNVRLKVFLSLYFSLDIYFGT